MFKHTKTTMRTAVIAAGAGSAVMIGSVAAGAADTGDAPLPRPGKTAGTIAEATLAQADTATKAAEAEKRKAEKARAWVSPVDKPYTFTGTYDEGGARWAAKHSGQDFAAPTGTPVKAARAGTVVEAGWGGSYGNNIVVKHENGKFTQYGHLSKMDAKLGDTVNTGEGIGKIGSTGNSSGPHLHFEVRTTPDYGSAVDPVAYMNKHGANL